MSRPLRVFYLINSLGPGGAQRQLVELVRGLAGYGVQATIGVYDTDSFYANDPRYAHLDIVTIPKSGTLDSVFALRVADILKRGQYDIAHPFLLFAGAWVIAASLATPNVRVVCHEQSDAAEGLASWHMMRWLTFPRADMVLANSKRATLHIRERFRIPPSRVYYVPNGLDASYWAEPTPPDAELQRVLANVVPDVPKLAAVGTVCEWKDQPTLAKALARIEPERRPVILVAGAEADESVARKLRRLIRHYGLERWMVPLGAVSDVRGLYHAVDGFVHASKFEGFPNVALEAMSAGLPLVTTTVSDLPELVETHRLGWLFEPGDVSGLAAQLREFSATSTRDREAMGRRGAALASEFTIDRAVQETLNCYHALMRQS